MHPFSLWHPRVFLVTLPLFYITIAMGCEICDDINESLELAPIPGYEFVDNCGTLQSVAGFLEPGSNECQLLQQIGSLCGCSFQNDPCETCIIPEAFLSIPVYLDTDTVNEYSTELATFLSSVTPFAPTCQLAQAFFLSVDRNDPICEESGLVGVVEQQCGCGMPSNATAPPNNSTLPKTIEEPCQLCKNPDETYEDLDRDITDIVRGAGLGVLFPYISSQDNITCGMLQEMASQSLASDNAVCNKAWVKPFQGLCGCPAIDTPNPCLQCGGNGPLYPDKTLDILVEIGYPFAPTCAEMDAILQTTPQSSGLCLGASQFAYLCGCGVRPYMGADTTTKQAVLAWLPRATGGLSFIGSALIIRSILRSTTKRNQMLPQLVFMMSLFDICSSVSAIFSSGPSPMTLSEYGIPSGIYGAKGNDATCKAQGFFVQLGYTAAIYNMVLSIYYLLVIKYNMRESALQKLKYWFHVPTLIVGVGLAFAGIPFYETIFVTCHVAPPYPLSVYGGSDEISLTGAETHVPVYIFSIVPLSIVMIVGSINMLIIYWHVRKQDLAANRWRINVRAEGSQGESPSSSTLSSRWSEWKSKLFSKKKNGQNNNTNPNRLSKAVFWQSVFYMSSFLLCWPIYFVANLRVDEKFRDYAFWVALVTLFPLQGFFNSLVYFRPQIAAYCKQKFEKKRRQQRQQMTAYSKNDTETIPNNNSNEKEENGITALTPQPWLEDGTSATTKKIATTPQLDKNNNREEEISTNTRTTSATIPQPSPISPQQTHLSSVDIWVGSCTNSITKE